MPVIRLTPAARSVNLRFTGKKMGSQSEIKVSEILSLLNRKAPSSTAESWDNVGLLLGDPDTATPGAVISDDLTLESIEKARSAGYRLIVNHHPCIFGRGLKRVTPGGGMRSIAFEALRAGISVVACHTNFDRCALEVPRRVAEGLGFEACGRLYEGSGPACSDEEAHWSRLEMEVPAESVPVLRKGLSEIVDEERIRETRGGLMVEIPAGLEKSIIQKGYRCHPAGREARLDLRPSWAPPPAGGLTRGIGYGVWGDLPQPKSFADVAQRVKRLFNIDGYWLTEPAPREIRRIAFAAGKGASFIGHASAVGCDLFVTGEAGYHAALEGARQGTAVMELGHRESELFFLRVMEEWLEASGLKTEVLATPTQMIHK